MAYFSKHFEKCRFDPTDIIQTALMLRINKRRVGWSRTNGVLESRTMRLRIVGSCRGYGKFAEISPPEQAWHISQNILRNVDLPQT